MTKKAFRYFAIFLGAQERWLNKMSASGWRLIKTNSLFYEFESCTPNLYEYKLDFVGRMSNEKRLDYKDTLTNMGYVLHDKGINANFSIGKMRWRPYATGKGQIATSPGGFNKEILIVERKQDGTPFELHSNYEDWVTHLKSMRSSLTNALFLFAVFTVLCAVRIVPAQLYVALIFGILSLLTLVIVCIFLFQIYKFQKLMRIVEY